MSRHESNTIFLLIAGGLLSTNLLITFFLLPVLPLWGASLVFLFLSSFLLLDYIPQFSIPLLHYAIVLPISSGLALSATAVTIGAVSFPTLLLGYISYVGWIVLVSTTSIVAVILGGVYAQKIIVRKEVLQTGKPLRIAHISDIHLGSIYGVQKVKQIVNHIQKLDPDIILITGDIFDGTGRPGKEWLEPFQKLERVYAVLGNHDAYFDAGKAQVYLEENNIEVLRNQKVEFKGYSIYGYDDEEVTYPVAPFIEPDTNPSICMYHRPGPKTFIQKMPYDLVLSGHVHRGQILPLGWLGKLLDTYFYGWYRLPDTTLNVSSGTATGGAPVRIGTSSEIVLIECR